MDTYLHEESRIIYRSKDNRKEKAFEGVAIGGQLNEQLGCNWGRATLTN